jgi:DNA-directed RNA polymerase III subunit RPC11
MLFCPTCANLLVISSETGYNKWACNTCPYEFPISQQVCPSSFLLSSTHQRPKTQMTSRTKLKRKQVDDVLGGDEMWKHADATAASCERCNHGQAYFYQLQIRSADEPMTTCAYCYISCILYSFYLPPFLGGDTVYRCASCGFRWREN